MNEDAANLVTHTLGRLTLHIVCTDMNLFVFSVEPVPRCVSDSPHWPHVNGYATDICRYEMRFIVIEELETRLYGRSEDCTDIGEVFGEGFGACVGYWVEAEVYCGDVGRG